VIAAIKNIDRRILVGAAFYVTLAAIALQHYIEWTSVNFLLGLLALGIAASTAKIQRPARRFAYWALLFSLLTIVLPVKTSLYFAIGAALLFVWENFSGKNNATPLLILGLMSPVFKYFSNVFSFPVRLQITELAGTLLNISGIPTTVQGNMIHSNGFDFAVDPECMGLNMMVTSLLLGIMLLLVYQKKFDKQLVWWKVLLFLGIVVLLNVLSNLLRIVCLVMLAIMPDTFMHEAMGIICLVVYVVLPSMWLAKVTVRTQGRSCELRAVSCGPQMRWPLHFIVGGCILFATYNVMKHDDVMHSPDGPVPSVNGYAVQRVSADIIRLENPQSLIYIKYIPGFYNSEHHPMICWKGSGYVFNVVKEQNLDGFQVYTAELHKGKERLYTAWWYDNGLNKTIAQTNWRLDVLKGGNNYSIVNVTAANYESLETEIKKITKENRLCTVFNN